MFTAVQDIICSAHLIFSSAVACGWVPGAAAWLSSSSKWHDYPLLLIDRERLLCFLGVFEVMQRNRLSGRGGVVDDCSRDVWLEMWQFWVSLSSDFFVWSFFTPFPLHLSAHPTYSKHNYPSPFIYAIIHLCLYPFRPTATASFEFEYLLKLESHI